MILLFGGTTEAKQVARCLEEAGLAYIYSTKTPVAFEGKGQYRYGPLDSAALEQLCAEQQISCIINASHPFARELHETVAAIAPPLPLLRFEREPAERQQHPLLTYVADYEQALNIFQEKGYESLLALSGVQSIPLLKPFWQHKCCWFRILERDSSKAFAARHGFPASHLLYGLPEEAAAEIELFRYLKPHWPGPHQFPAVCSLYKKRPKKGLQCRWCPK